MTDLTTLEQKINDLTVNLDARDSRLTNSLFAPDKAPHYQDLAIKLAASELTPKAYRNKPKDLFLAWELGYQLGFSLTQAMQAIAVINGHPAVYGDGLLALVLSHPEFVDIKEEEILQNDEIVGFRCTIKRANRSPVSRSFTLTDAKRAKLLGKPGPWTDYQSRMLQMRARSYACRDAFADALKGLKSAEELHGQAIEGQFEEVKPSRTELLKSDYQQKEKNNARKNMVEDSIVDNSAADEEDHFDGRVAGAGPQETETSSQDGSFELVTLAQISQINALLKKKKFTDERKKAALAHYGVEDAQDLTSEQAIDLINKLDKA